MALSYPLSIASFMDILPISKMSLTVPGRMQTNVTKSGERISADIGARIWSGSVTLGPITRAEFGAVQAMLDALRSANTSFFVYDVSMPGPQADLTGAILGASTPTISSLPTGNDTMALTGLPVGYTLTPGDRLSFLYTNGSTRYALHRVLESAVADGTGTTPAFQVVPPIRAGATTSTAVQLIKPYCKAELVPGSITDPQVMHTIADGGVFSFQQTLR